MARASSCATWCCAIRRARWWPRSARLDVALSLRGLFGNRIDSSHVDLERPRLHLVQSRKGLNLARAVAPKEPSPKTEQSEPSSLIIVLRRLRLADGAVRFHDTRKEGPPDVAAGEARGGRQRRGGAGHRRPSPASCAWARRPARRCARRCRSPSTRRRGGQRARASRPSTGARPSWRLRPPATTSAGRTWSSTASSCRRSWWRPSPPACRWPPR